MPPVSSPEESTNKSAKAKRNTMPWPVLFALVAACSGIIYAPSSAAQWIDDTLTGWQLLLLLGVALVVSLALLRKNKRGDWLGYGVDFLAVVCLCSAAGAIVELTSVGSAQLLGMSMPTCVAVVGGVVFLQRAEQRFARSVRPAHVAPPEPPEDPPVVFRYDGEAIVVYPRRRRLARHALFTGGVMLVFAGLAFPLRGLGSGQVPGLGLLPVGPLLVLGCGVIAAIIGLLGVLPDLVRLLHRWPALIVDSDGITDLASARLIGFGFIPWHEIAGFEYWALLEIHPVSRERLLRRQPILKRAVLRVTSLLAICILPMDLSESPELVYRKIYSFVFTHAPAGYFEPVHDEPHDTKPAE